MDIRVGDEIRFDHFGGTDRLGKVVKVTATKIHVEWTEPSSGKVRVVPLTTKTDQFGNLSDLIYKNVQREPQAFVSLWNQKVSLHSIDCARLGAPGPRGFRLCDCRAQEAK